MTRMPKDCQGIDVDFDQTDLLPFVARERASASPRQIPFEHFQDGSWRPITMVEHVRRVDELAGGLLARGVEPGDRIAVMMSTRYEWILLDMAIWAAGAITVPIFPASSAAQREWILEDSGAVLLFAETAEDEELLTGASLPPQCREIFYLDQGDLDQLRGEGQAIEPAVADAALETLTPDSIATIVYTPVAGGLPKGCVLTHANLLAECHGLMAQRIGVSTLSGCKIFMVLPLTEVLGRVATYTAFIGGGTIGFWGDTSTMLPRFSDFRPGVILGIPQIFGRVRDDCAELARAKGRLSAAIFARAEKVAIEKSRRMGGSGLGNDMGDTRPQAALFKFYDRLVFSAVRAALGGRCELAVSGGGAFLDDIAHFFRGVGVPICDGYGLTESTSAVTVNGPGMQRVGTVGTAVGSNEIRIADTGEVQLRGPVIFGGYWQNPEATEAAFEDGWFCTGDLGSLDADGYLSITGRLK